MSLTTRKFYKLNGLNGVFQLEDLNIETDTIKVYNTTTSGLEPAEDLESIGIKNIDEHTILFIIASKEDEGTEEEGYRYVNIGVLEQDEDSDSSSDEYEYEDAEEEVPEEIQKRHRIKEGDTMIWSRGNLYCVTPTNSVTEIEFTQNREFIITYSDGSKQTIEPGESGLGYGAEYPIVIESEDDIPTIKLKGLSIDSDKNFIENPDENYANYGVTNSHVEGTGNFSSANNQHVQGKFAALDTSAIFIIGNGNDDNNRKNIFTIGYDGKVYALTDVVCGPDKSNPDYKLSDIHSVLNEDWCFVGDRYSSYDNSYNPSFDIDEDITPLPPAEVYIDDEPIILDGNLSYAEQEYTELYSQNTYPIGSNPSNYLINAYQTYPVTGEAYWTYCIEEQGSGPGE